METIIGGSPMVHFLDSHQTVFYAVDRPNLGVLRKPTLKVSDVTENAIKDI